MIKNYLLFRFVYIGTLLAQVEVCLLTGINTFNFQEGGVLPLVSKATLVASKNGLAPQPEGIENIYKLQFTPKYQM